jgi:hypothetical protein
MAKEEILIDLKIDAEESNESINSLRASVREMTKARNEANLSTAEGRATVQSLNQAIDANNAKIKSNIDSLTKQRMNVGNYKKDIQDAIPALDKFTGGAVSAGQGILTMTKQALTFIATPIGAILAAVAATLALVTAALKRSEPAIDLFDDAIGSITEGARFLVDNLAAIGSVLGNLFTGNMAEAAATTGKLAEEFKNAQRESQRLREEFRELEDEEAKLIAATAGTEAQIKALIIQSKNRNLTEAERIALLKEAEELERTSTEQKVAYENRKSAATIQQIGTERDLRQAQGETIDAYVQRLIASEKLSGEEKKAVAEAYAARVNASTATLALQEKIQNAQDAAFLKQEEEAKVRSQVERERLVADSEFKLALLRQEVDAQKLLLDEIAAYANANSDAALLKKQELNEQLNIQLDEEAVVLDQKQEAALQKDLARARQRVEIARLTEFQKLGFVSQGIALASNLLDRQSGEYKALAVTQGLINTYAGAAAAVAPPPVGAGPVFGPILAALTIASGLVNVGKIAGFANGGLIKMGAGLPIQRSNGDNVLATVKTGEVILNQRQQSALGGASTFRSIGVPGFAEGGVVGFPSSTISGATNSFFDLSGLEQTISNLKVQVAVTDINDGQKNYAEITDRAQF